MGLVLTIDIGTTNLKAGVVDSSGKLLTVSKARIPIKNDLTGRSEHDPEELMELLLTASETAIRKFKGQIELIAVSTYQFGLILTDKNVKPLTGISLLTDTRARKTFEEFSAFVDPNTLYLKTGCPLIFQYPLARLFYLKNVENSLFSEAHYFLSSKDYIFYRLTNELFAEPSTAAASQLMDVHTLNWSEYALQKAGIRESQLPPITDGTKLLCPVSSVIKSRLGLNSTVKVLLGVYDSAALAVAQSGLQPDVGVMNVGTSAMLRVASSSPAFDLTGAQRINPYSFNKGTYLNGGSLNNAALCLDWFNTNVSNIDLVNLKLSDKTKTKPLFCVPYLTGERNPTIGAHASGVLFGFNTKHNSKDIALAFLEGIAFSLCFVKNALDENSIEINKFCMSGGGTAWSVWPEIFANIFNTPIHVSEFQEQALIGNALLAFVANHTFSSLDEGFKNMIHGGSIIEPSETLVNNYCEHFQFFKSLCQSLTPLFQEHSKLT